MLKKDKENIYKLMLTYNEVNFELAYNLLKDKDKFSLNDLVNYLLELTKKGEYYDIEHEINKLEWMKGEFFKKYISNFITKEAKKFYKAEVDNPFIEFQDYNIPDFVNEETFELIYDVKVNVNDKEYETDLFMKYIIIDDRLKLSNFAFDENMLTYSNLYDFSEIHNKLKSVLTNLINDNVIKKYIEHKKIKKNNNYLQIYNFLVKKIKEINYDNVKAASIEACHNKLIRELNDEFPIKFTSNYSSPLFHRLQMKVTSYDKEKDSICFISSSSHTYLKPALYENVNLKSLIKKNLLRFKNLQKL